MDNRFDDILKEGMERCYVEKGIQTPNNVQQGNALTEFYVKEIGQFLYKIQEEDIEENLCDGKGDIGIDFVYQKDRDWLIFQAKYKGQKKPLSSDEISGFFDVYRKISNRNYFYKHANSLVKRILGDFREGDSIQFIFVTNAQLTTKNEDDFNELKRQHEGDEETVSYELKGLTDLKKDYKVVTSEMQAIAEDVTINIESIADSFVDKQRRVYFDVSNLIDKEKRYQSLMCIIKGNTLKNLWQQHSATLFNYNIRGFLGENAINKKMKDTLEREPDKFFFYNNGISAICTSIIPEIENGEVRALRCKNFSIINGAQTTTTIGRFKNVNNLQQVRVLLKITKAEDYKKEKGLNKKIIAFNNSQTLIKVADFRSNDDIQIFLEGKLSDFLYKGTNPFKKVVYQRKRIKEEKKKDTLYIPMETLARVLYTFDNDPILIFKGTKSLFDIDSENNGKYWFVFGDDGEEVELYDQKRIEKIIALYFLWIRVEDKIKATSKKIKSEQIESIRYQALLAKWHILWAYGYIVNNLYKEQLDAVFKKIATGKLFADQETFIERWFNKIQNTIAKCIERNYDSSKKTDNQEIQSFNFKNWLRNNSDFQELVREFKYMDQSDFPL